MRITDEKLQKAVDRLNDVTGSPIAPYAVDQQTPGVCTILKFQPGNFHLDFAYGGVALHRIAESGGSIDLTGGHLSKREVFNFIHAYIAGYAAGKFDASK